MEVPQVAGGLTRLLPQHHGLRADEAERIDNHLALHTLHGVHDHCYSALVQGLKALHRWVALRGQVEVRENESVGAVFLCLQ